MGFGSGYAELPQLALRNADLGDPFSVPSSLGCIFNGREPAGARVVYGNLRHLRDRSTWARLLRRTLGTPNVRVDVDMVEQRR